jgi:hypothetical protein
VLRVVLFAFVLFSATNAICQAFEEDARLWLTINLNKEIGKRIETQVLLQNRLSENMTRYAGYISLGSAYRFTKKFKVLAGYTYGIRPDDELEYEAVHKFFTGIMTRFKLQHFTLSYRGLCQWQSNGVTLFDDRKAPYFFLRNKVTARYDLKKRWQAYASGEFYVPLQYEYKYDYIARSRISVGAVYKVSKRRSVEGFFMLQQDNRYTSRSTRNFVYGLTYNVEF